jgi:hypothetical protein
MICEAMMRRVGAGVSVGWVTPESGTAAMWPEIGVIPESPTRKLIWCDLVNIFEWLGWFLHLSFRGQDQQQPWQVMATIDQADIRGSEPHNHDPSGAASDYLRESG